MAIDQAHEQNNAAVKSDGGGVGLTQSLTEYGVVSSVSARSLKLSNVAPGS